MLKLNLGCSDDLKAGWLNVDVDSRPGMLVINSAQVVNHLRSDQPVYAQWDLRDPWPFYDVDEIKAHDVFEHIGLGHVSPRDSPRGTVPGKIWVMNEAHRVLKPGGVLDIVVPAVETTKGMVCRGAFADPTHATYWTVEDRWYYDVEQNHPQGERGRLGPAYGITALFRFDHWEHFDYAPGRAKLRGKLIAVK